MRIALDATYAAQKQPTGVGVYSAEMIAGLAGEFPDDSIVLAYRPHRYLRSLRHRLPPNGRRRILWETRSLFRADLFHGLNQRLPAAAYRRRIATFHDLFVLTGEYSTPEFRHRFAEQARAAAERADRIIAVSEFTARQVQECLDVDRARIRVVPHGVRPPASVPVGAEREPLVLCVGAIQRRKNTARLVRAFRALPPPWRLVLAGGDGYGAEETHEAIRQSPVADRIRTPGFVSAAELDSLYARARVLAFPSLDEGFGIPVLEAMAWGVAVLTSTTSALPEVGGEAVHYVDPHDEEAITAGLRTLTQDEEYCETLRNRGRTRAAEFTWDRSVRMTAAVYRELLD